MAKIMLVEDDNNLREIYGARLAAEGHTIVAAKDGEEALALAVKEKPELIISDVMMPRISGFDMLDILRNAPETKNTKIIMMTALSQAEDKARADKLGADLYLVKSQVTLEDVAKAVEKVLAGESVAPPVPDTPEQGTNETETNDAPAADTPPPQPPDEPDPKAPAQPEPPAGQNQPAETTPATAPEPTPTEEPQPLETPGSSEKPALPAPSDNAPQPNSATPKKIEVVLPDAGNEPEKKMEESKEESAPPEESTVVGPTLAEALAQEEGGSQSENAPAAAEETDDTPKIEVENSSIQPMNTDEKPQADANQPEAKKTLSSGQRKVLRPIEDSDEKPDLATLAAQEEAKDEKASPTEPQQSAAAPSQPETQSAPDATEQKQASNDQPPSEPDQNGEKAQQKSDSAPSDEFSKIAL